MKNLIKLIREIYYGVKFDYGYSYKRVKGNSLTSMRLQHEILTELSNSGFEKYTDPKRFLFSSYECWYRRKNDYKAPETIFLNEERDDRMFFDSRIKQFVKCPDNVILNHDDYYTQSEYELRNLKAGDYLAR